MGLASGRQCIGHLDRCRGKIWSYPLTQNWWSRDYVKYITGSPPESCTITIGLLLMVIKNGG